MNKTVFFIAFAGLCLLIGCSYEKNTWTSKTYHNMTAHYNGYFYAAEEIKKIEETILKSNVDDYNRILRLYPTFDSTLAEGYLKEIEEAIKMASISIQRHPNSKWVDDAYLLVGKARMYSLDWGNAIETFKYVNTKSKDPKARHAAIIHLIRTFTEHEEFNSAQSAIDYLGKEKLSKRNLKDYYLEKAYFYQVREDYDNMVRSLTQASPLLTKKDRRGRIYFIIGQVYQKLDFESEAFNFYKKCLATNPEYETDFYARLYMAQVAEISRSRDINTARKSFRRLLKDRKNREFKDKIYYELGIFEFKQKNLPQAITNFNNAIREKKNKRIGGEAYLKLGEIYYDTLRDYETSQAYYDSAIGALPQDYENYAAIKARQEVLNEFVKNLKTIEWQDSLLSMAALDSVALRHRIDSIFDEKKKLEELARGKKKKRRSNRIEIAPTEGNIFGTGSSADGSEWYFGNPSAMSLGESEFQRLWGDVPLEDDWRRSMKGGASARAAPDVVGVSGDTEDSEQAANSVAIDPVNAEFERINKQIPRTEEQKQEALKKIEDAYFRLGDIFYFDLMEKENAYTTYKTLLERFPESEYVPEVLYKLYLITKDSDPEQAEQYAEMLKKNYPFSTFAKILINPDYLKESSQTAERQKALYKTAYDHYLTGHYIEATLTLDEGMALGQTIFSANLELLKILIIGKTESIQTYQNALQEFPVRNPDSDLVPYVNKLMATSKEFELTQERKLDMAFVLSPEESHYFVIAYKRSDNMDVAASGALETFNNANFPNLQLKTSNLTLSDDFALTIVGDLQNASAARQYYKTFDEKLTTLPALPNHKFDKFVITSDNFNILYRTKGLNEYLQFFEKNYLAQTP